MLSLGVCSPGRTRGRGRDQKEEGDAACGLLEEVCLGKVLLVWVQEGFVVPLVEQHLLTICGWGVPMLSMPPLHLL